MTEHTNVTDELKAEQIDTLIKAGYMSGDTEHADAAWNVEHRETTVEDLQTLSDAAKEVGKEFGEEYYKAAWAVDDATAEPDTSEPDHPDIEVGDTFIHGGRELEVISTRKNMGAMWVKTESLRGSVSEWNADALDNLERA